MERPALESPEKYVKQRLAREIDVEKSDIRQEMFKPFVEYKFEDSGVFETDINNLHLKLAYRPIAIPDRINMEDYMRRVNHENHVPSPEELLSFVTQAFEQFGNPKTDIKEITDFVLGNGTQRWNLMEACPGIKFYISTLTDHVENFDIFEGKNNQVFLLGSYLLSPAGLITALHEFGHANTLPDLLKGDSVFESLEKSRKWSSDINSTPSVKDSAVVIEVERAAWAYAFKTLRPFLKDVGITSDDISKFKDLSLKTYYSGASLAAILSKESAKIK